MLKVDRSDKNIGKYKSLVEMIESVKKDGESKTILWVFRDYDLEIKISKINEVGKNNLLYRAVDIQKIKRKELKKCNVKQQTDKLNVWFRRTSTKYH